MNNSDFLIDFGDELTETGKDFYNDQIDFLQTSRAYSRY